MPVADPHSFARPLEAVVRHLSLHLSVDFDQQQLSGTATLDLITAPGAKEVVLDTRGLRIEAVTLDSPAGPATDFTLGEAVPFLGQSLTIAIRPDTRRVVVRYRTAVEGADALQWLAPAQTAGRRQPLLFTQSQAILARTWVPIQDSPGIRFTYDARIEVPTHLLALMSATNPTERRADGVYVFKMPQPIPAYLLALAVGDLAFRATGPRTGVYAEPASLEAAAWEFVDLEKMVGAAEALYGPYRWEQYDLLLLPPSFPFGGMENPRLTFVTPTIVTGDRSLTSLVAHELAHSWSGNLVTNATWNDFWLNEGYTVYFERRIMESLYGADYAEMLQQLGTDGLHHTIAALPAEDTRLKLDLAGRDPDDGVTEIAYEKGELLLLAIEAVIGRPRMDRFIREYFDRHAFQSMNTEGWLKYVRTELLDEFPDLETRVPLDQWIYQPALPASAPMISSARFRAVDAQLAAWQRGKTSADALTTTDWSSHEWVHFVRNLSESVTTEQLAELDAAFHFTQSGNAEIQAQWFQHTIRANYQPAADALARFLTTVGRRKFLVPLYKGLIQTEAGRAEAKRIYALARPNYHAVATATFDEMVGR
jgi:leukotriene-A4 hydrolase